MTDELDPRRWARVIPVNTVNNPEVNNIPNTNLHGIKHIILLTKRHKLELRNDATALGSRLFLIIVTGKYCFRHRGEGSATVSYLLFKVDEVDKS